jgi:Holliday junction resolvase
LEKSYWKVIRAGASLGEADLVCIKKGKSIFIQVKSTKKKVFYYYGFMEDKLEGLLFYLVVDFGYGKIRILPPQKKVFPEDGQDFKEFLKST